MLIMIAVGEIIAQIKFKNLPAVFLASEQNSRMRSSRIRLHIVVNLRVGKIL